MSFDVSALRTFSAYDTVDSLIDI